MQPDETKMVFVVAELVCIKQRKQKGFLSRDNI